MCAFFWEGEGTGGTYSLYSINLKSCRIFILIEIDLGGVLFEIPIIENKGHPNQDN